MNALQHTVLHDQHVALGGHMVAFGGWQMPLHYKEGIVAEHLATRKKAGLFDVAHMGRLRVSGKDALAFLQHVLTNAATALLELESQYTMIANETGGAVDDAYLYRFLPDEYLLVVNAANRQKDLDHFQRYLPAFANARIEDISQQMAMLSLQGPAARAILEAVISEGALPEPLRNSLSIVQIAGIDVWVARTGYTGEPICFELFFPSEAALDIWKRLTAAGAVPVGLGARDTLRLEAGLPLYGHELGDAPEGGEIPIFACPLARFAVSFAPSKGDFVGKQPLAGQFAAFRQIIDGKFDRLADLPRRIMPMEMIGKGIARSGCSVLWDNAPAGVITSGTMVPYWHFEGDGISAKPSAKKGQRAIALALVDSRLREYDPVQIDVRGRMLDARIVPFHLRGEAPPYARPILCHGEMASKKQLHPVDPSIQAKVEHLAQRVLENHQWRQQRCINLIPSEQSLSAAVRLLSIADPAGRYAEHKALKALCEEEVFYYQGTEFIAEVEQLLAAEMASYLACENVEVRPISGQMANTALFSALVDWRNRADRKSEQRRIRSIINHHIIKGGHLSAQPMGALRDFVARDPMTEKPAIVNFPVKKENPYEVDVKACGELLETHRPELIICGRSMTICKEPTRQLRGLIDQLDLPCILHYDMAHVLGLVGPHFQQPFSEGVDVVTGSTHKTFFGTQRGVIAADWDYQSRPYELWEAIQRRAFPGSVSNHHLGTLLGLLMAAYEMNAFKESYQPAVIANARAFARALKDCGFDVAGDPAKGFTETHQVIVHVGYGRGPEIARLLEANNIIVNYQAAPEEEGFTAAGSLRMGVAEMTRFGMQADDFGQLSELMAEAAFHGRAVSEAVAQLRKRFCNMQFCFTDAQFEEMSATLHRLI